MLILTLIAATTLMLSTPFSMGSACPISPTLALTARHIIDPKPFDPTVPLLDGFWSDPTDPWVKNGKFSPVLIYRDRDLGLIAGDFPAFFLIATKPPSMNENLYIQGFDWRKKNKVFSPRLWKVKPQFRSGQMLSLSEDSQPGSSGACALNEAGEVVGILTWSFETDDDLKSGIIVLIYGEEFKGKN